MVVSPLSDKVNVLFLSPGVVLLVVQPVGDIDEIVRVAPTEYEVQ